MNFSAGEIRAAWARYLGKVTAAMLCAPEDDEREEGEEGLENGILVES